MLQPSGQVSNAPVPTTGGALHTLLFSHNHQLHCATTSSTDRTCAGLLLCCTAAVRPHAQVYRSYVFQRPAFIEYFNLATPVGELGRLNIGGWQVCMLFVLWVAGSLPRLCWT